MLRQAIQRWRQRRYDDVYRRARARRIERERRMARELGAFRVFTHADADLTTGSLPQMRLE